MNAILLTLALLALSTVAYQSGRRRALCTVGGVGHLLHSRPGYHGAYVLLWCLIPTAAVVTIWISFEGIIVDSLVTAAFPGGENLSLADRSLFLTEIRNVAADNTGITDPEKLALGAYFSDLRLIGTGGMIALALAAGSGGIYWARRLIAAKLRARQRVERMVLMIFVICSTLAILTTLGIVLSLLFEALRFFAKVSVVEFLFGLHWSPQTALRDDQVGASGAFGAVPVITGTLLITFISMLVAVPIGLMSAVYMAEYATQGVRAWVKPALEVLAGVPTVVYGFFAALTVGPFIRELGTNLGLDVASESALAAGLVMGIMIVPFVSSLSDDVINAVPQGLRDGAYALGATKSETIRQVVLPAALPGIIGSVLLAVSRAIGETMIVVMAAGLAANLTANPLQAVTTVTVQIVTLLVGDQEFDSAKTLAAFALGLVLFLLTLLLNVIALIVVRRYREKYD